MPGSLIDLLQYFIFVVIGSLLIIFSILISFFMLIYVNLDLLAIAIKELLTYSYLKKN